MDDYIYVLGFLLLIIAIVFIVLKSEIFVKKEKVYNTKKKLDKSKYSSDPRELIKGSPKAYGILSTQDVRPIKPLEKNIWTTSDGYDEDHKKIENEKYQEKIESNGISILLVDDSMVVRKKIGDLLRKEGYSITLKNDGWDALTYLTGNIIKPELIISDIEMPNMNGIQLINSLRKEQKYTQTPILVISAHAETHLELMENEQIQGFIKKPFEDKDLIAQVVYLLNSH